MSEGHPDKVCDQISDAVLDAYLAEDPEARVACETFATTNRVIVGGEVRGPEGVLSRVEDIVRQCVRDIGYAQKGFNWENLEVHNYIHGQSVHIAQGVDGGDGKEEGAGDQGIMFGYAVDETARAHAGADPLRARGAAPSRPGAQERRRAAAGAGREVAAVAALRRRAAGRDREPGALHPARRRGHDLGRRARRWWSRTSAPSCPRGG